MKRSGTNKRRIIIFVLVFAVSLLAWLIYLQIQKEQRGAETLFNDEIGNVMNTISIQLPEQPEIKMHAEGADWKMTAPFTADVSTKSLQHLTTLLAEPIQAIYQSEGKDLSNFGLDVDCPYPKPSPESVGVKPERMPYPKNEIRYGHYGFIIQELIGKACELDEGDDKTAMVLAIANLMKKHFLTYNRLTANDQIIADQLATLSGGKLIFTNLDQLISTKEVMKSNGYQSNQQKRKPNYKNKKSNNFKRKNY